MSFHSVTFETINYLNIFSDGLNIITRFLGSLFYNFYLQINNNGIISFNRSFSDFRPKQFPLSSNRSLIAPFWADSDTRSSRGTVWFGIRNNDFNLLEKARQDVTRYFSSQQNFAPNFLLVSTWEKVPHFRSGYKVNEENAITNGIRISHVLRPTCQQIQFIIIIIS